MSFIEKLMGWDKRLKEAAPLPTLTDIHSHLVPGIDDGSQNMEESIKLVKELYNLGYKKIITTPHIMGDHFKNTKSGILEGVAKLKEAVKNHGIPVEIEAACEYYMDDHFMSLVEKDELLTFGDRYVLVETNTVNYTEMIRNAFFQLGLGGYKAVFAHPERYVYFWNNFNRYQDFRDMGIFFQINLVSLSGFYGQKVKSITEKLIDLDLVDFVGTDTHEMHYIDAVQQARFSPYMLKLAGKNLLNDSL